MSENNALMAAQAQAVFADKFWARVAPAGPDECWLWTGHVNWAGYGSVGMNVRGKWREMKAHRVAFALTNGREPRDCVLHKCDVRLCVNPGHLFEGSREDNLNDMRAKGREVRGVKYPQAKLSDDAVRDVRRKLAAGVSQHSIAKEYGVSQPVISKVKSGIIWYHVKEEEVSP